MESGKISDDQISASSSFYDSRWLPRQARLNNDDNAWTPSEDSNKEYIQVGRLYYYSTAGPLFSIFNARLGEFASLLRNATNIVCIPRK